MERPLTARKEKNKIIKKASFPNTGEVFVEENIRN